MLAFIRLIRPWNLLIIAFTMYVIRYCIIKPVLDAWGLHLSMPELYFSLLCAAVVMVAAAGYIINDYFDVRIDRINKPDEVVVDKGVKRRVAMMAHLVINAMGVLLGLWVSWKSQLFSVGAVIFVFAASALWFYSTDFKRKFLIGNIIISLLSALIPFIPALYELSFLASLHADAFMSKGVSFNPVMQIVLAIAVFAFMLSWIRELIKDMEDVEGDREFGCRTLPIVLGITTGKIVAVVLSAVVLAMVTLVQIALYDAGGLFTAKNAIPLYITGLQVMLVVLSVLVLRAKAAPDFRRASMLTKLIMLAGICSSLVFAWLVQRGIWAIGA